MIKSSYVLKHKKIHGDKVIAFLTPRIHEADTFEDFDYLEYQVTRNPEIVDRLFNG